MASFVRKLCTCSIRRNLWTETNRNAGYIKQRTNQSDFSTKVCSFCAGQQVIRHDRKLRQQTVRYLHNNGPRVLSRTCSSILSRLPLLKKDPVIRIPAGIQSVLCRKYSEGPPGSWDGQGGDNPPGGFVPLADNTRKSLAPVTVPEYFPNVPVISISKNPVYPKFVKMIEVSDKDLISLIQRKVRLGQPYAGVFMKKDEGDESEVASSLDGIHDVGVFVQIAEMMDHGEKLHLYVVAHRLIRINRLLNEDEDIDPLQQEINNLSDKLAASYPSRRQRRRRNNNGSPEVIQVDSVQMTAEGAKNIQSEVNGNTTTQTEGQPEGEAKDISTTQTEGQPGIPEGEVKDVSRTKVLMVETNNYMHEPYENDDMMKALTSEVIKTIKDIVTMNALFRENVGMILNPVNKVFDNPIFICNLGAMLSSADPKEQQEVLEERNIPNKLSLVLNMLKKEYERCKIQKTIGEEVEKKIREKNREFMLKEQLKVIKKELGMQKDEGASLKEKYLDRLKDKTVPEVVQKVIDEEMDRLSYLDGESSEFNSLRNYLDWLTILPWGMSSQEKLDIKHAHQVLDEDHYGMKDVKDRILEFIAVSQLKGDTQGKIMCFHGPPGVGKTSIAKSIARAINREYFRFSVGGLHDVAEIKGHRRTYVGSMPGKMIQCLKRVSADNPLVLIDEVDKIGRRGFEGDPSSALLELLDPEQNANFLDHYLDVPVDVSKVLFICTANVTHTIPDALKDRMELIEVSGYVAEEKLAIAQKYLMPQALEHSGLKEEQISISDDALRTLIHQYCRESGVRNLQKKIEKIYRKVAFKIVQEEPTEKVDVTTDNLNDFVGNPIYTLERLYQTTPPGVVTGLAWTAAGGSPLYIEVVKYDSVPVKAPETGVTTDTLPTGTGGLQVTGNLKDVMKESTTIAYTYAMSWLQQNKPDNHFFRTSKLHLHFPEGATPKDGPSAGSAITTALLSLAMDQPCRQDMAMTGEISLTGKVLRIGGVKEKVLAARREGIKTVIMPFENKPDFEELESFIKEGLDVHFVKHYNDVFEIAFSESNDSHNRNSERVSM